jgi:hypothetical protein
MAGQSEAEKYFDKGLVTFRDFRAWDIHQVKEAMRGL